MAAGPREVPTSRSPAKSRLPMKPPLPNPPKARVKAMVAQTTASSPMAKMFCMSMPSTFLARTMPP